MTDKPLPITVERLDELADFVINPKPSTRVQAVIAACKILVVLAYLFARKRILDAATEVEQMRKDKQAYEQAKVAGSRGEIASEDAFAKQHGG